jgi:hypothetical protein
MKRGGSPARTSRRSHRFSRLRTSRSSRRSVRSLNRGATRRRWHFLDAHLLGGTPMIRFIMFPDHEARSGVPRPRLTKLLSGPCGGRMRCSRTIQNGPHVADSYHPARGGGHRADSSTGGPPASLRRCSSRSIPGRCPWGDLITLARGSAGRRGLRAPLKVLTREYYRAEACPRKRRLPLFTLSGHPEATLHASPVPVLETDASTSPARTQRSDEPLRLERGRSPPSDADSWLREGCRRSGPIQLRPAITDASASCGDV